MVAPDDKMTMPIEDLVFWAARCVKRTAKLIEMTADDPDNEQIQKVAEREDEFVRAYRIALKLRAKEIAEFADRLGLMNCTPQMVRADGFAVCLALMTVITGDPTGGE